MHDKFSTLAICYNKTMNVLIIGTVMKDVYLNLDSRKESFEIDKHNTKWLNLSFDASEHFFFHRKSCLGGAAITLETLSRLGLDAKIIGSDLELTEDGLSQSPTDVYRYILISDQTVSYFAPSTHIVNSFTPPQKAYDYVFVDRSANLDDQAVDHLVSYLESNPRTTFALYLSSTHTPRLEFLAKIADIVFVEVASPKSSKLSPSHIAKSPHRPNWAPATANRQPSVDNPTNPQPNLVDETQLFIYLNEHSITSNNLTERLSPSRIDVSTHLSTYSTISATILGGIMLGFSLKTCFKLARANAENSKLDSTLSLTKLQSLIDDNSSTHDLELTAASLLVKPKGILAADESGGSIKKKFAKLNIPDTFESRRSYRDILLTAPDLEQYVNGVILFDETTRQSTNTGENFVDYLISHHIIPGIKVDQGLKNYPDSEETYTTGLEGLDKRLDDYYKLGLRFAKWRAAFEIRLDHQNHILTPTKHAVIDNCRILAEYAKICQDHRIVPIVEPEVVYDGYYSIKQSAAVSAKILDTLFTRLTDLHVDPKACILKTSMVIAGKHYPAPSTPEEVGYATARVLKDHVPPDLAGIVFLSGGQTVEQSTDNLAAIIQNGPFPWPVTFSFARALQDPALYAWNGNNSNTESAKSALLERLIANTSVL